MATGGNICKQVLVEFDRSLMSHFTVEQFNALVDGLSEMHQAPTVWEAGSVPPPFGVTFDFSRLQRAHYRLDGIDLSLCWLADSNFTGASLKDAQMGCCPRTSFRNARLQGADFTLCDISDCDFAGAELEGTIFDGAVYAVGHEPVGLPTATLALCKPEAVPPPVNPRTPENPQEPTGPTVCPLKCSATIHWRGLGVVSKIITNDGSGADLAC